MHPNRLPVSVVHTLLSDTEEIIDAVTLKTMNEQVDEFLDF